MHTSIGFLELFHLLCREGGKLTIYFPGLLAARFLDVNWFCHSRVFTRDLESGKKAIPLCHLSMEFLVNKWALANGSAGRGETPRSSVGWMGGGDNSHGLTDNSDRITGQQTSGSQLWWNDLEIKSLVAPSPPALPMIL